MQNCKQIWVFVVLASYMLTIQAQLYVPYRVDSLWGVADSNLNIIVKPIYTKATFFEAFVKYSYSYGYRRSSPRYFQEPPILLYANNKCGIFYKGKIIVPVKYDNVGIEDQIWIARLAEKSEFYNSKGQNLLGDSLFLVRGNSQLKVELDLNLDNCKVYQFESSNGNYYVKVYNEKTQKMSPTIIKSKYIIDFLNFVEEEPKKTSGQIEMIEERIFNKIACSVWDNDNKRRYYVLTKNSKGIVTKKLASSAQIVAINNYGNYVSKEGGRYYGSISDKGAGSGDPGEFSLERFGNHVSSFFVEKGDLWKMNLRFKNYKLLDTLGKIRELGDSCTDFYVVDYHRNHKLRRSNNLVYANYAFYRKNKKWHVHNGTNQFTNAYDTIIPTIFYYENHEYIIGKHTNLGKYSYGLINVEKGSELPPLYDSFNRHGFPQLAYQNGKVFLLSSNCKIFSPAYDSVNTIGTLNTYFLLAYQNNKVKLVRINSYEIMYQSPWLNKDLRIAEPKQIVDFDLYPISNSKGEFLGYVSASGKYFYKQ